MMSRYVRPVSMRPVANMIAAIRNKLIKLRPMACGQKHQTKPQLTTHAWGSARTDLNAKRGAAVCTYNRLASLLLLYA